MENNHPETEEEKSGEKPSWLCLLHFFSFLALAFMGALVFQSIAVVLTRSLTEYPFVSDPVQYFRDNPSHVQYFWLFQLFNTIGFFLVPCFVFPYYLRERPL